MSLGLQKTRWTVGGVALVPIAIGVATAWGMADPLRRAERAAAHGGLGTAIETALRYRHAHPESRAAASCLARSYSALGQWAEAARYFSEAGDSGGADRRLRAAALAHMGQWNQSADLLEGLLQENSDDPELL